MTKDQVARALLVSLATGVAWPGALRAGDADYATRSPPPRVPSLVLRDWQQGIRMLREHSAELRLADDEVQAVAADRETAWGGVLPRLAASGSVRRELTAGSVCDVQSLTCIDNRTVYLGSLTFVQPLFAPSAWATVARTGKDLAATEAAAADRRRVLTLRYLEHAASVLMRERLVAAARASARAAGERAALIRRAATAGAMDAVDVLRTEQDEAQAVRAVLEGELALQREREDLGALLGQIGEVSIAEGFKLDDALNGCGPGDAGARGDVEAARLRSQAAEALVSDVRWRLAPTLEIAGSYSILSVPLPSGSHQASSLAGVLSVPLWDLGLFGRINAARAVAAQSIEQLDATAQTAQREQAGAIRRVEIARAAREGARRTSQLASKTEGLARTAVEEGAGTALELIEAGRRLRESDTAAVVADVEASLAELTAKLVSARCRW